MYTLPDSLLVTRTTVSKYLRNES